LVDGIAVGDIGDVHIPMTLTTPGCPAAPALPREVQTRITAIPGVCRVNVGVVGELGSVTPVTNPNQEEDTI
jgi:metal-sulfur cluster biosynthetic enzyme